MEKGYTYWVYLPGATISEGYIGVAKNFARRKKEHLRNASKSTLHFANAITKYSDSLVWEILFEGPLEGCYQVENYFRPAPELGWNIAIGGATSNNLSRNLSKATKNKISASKIGHTPWNKGKTGVYDESTLQVMSQASKARTQGADNPMFGKCHTPEAKRRISIANKGKPGFTGKDNPMATKVRCVETSEVFDTITEAATFIGCSVQNLSMHLKGLTKTAKKLTWEYVKENE